MEILEGKIRRKEREEMRKKYSIRGKNEKRNKIRKKKEEKRNKKTLKLMHNFLLEQT